MMVLATVIIIMALQPCTKKDEYYKKTAFYP